MIQARQVIRSFFAFGMLVILAILLTACGENTSQIDEQTGEKETVYFAGLRTIGESIEGVNNMTYAFQETFAAFNAESTEYQVEAVVYSDETSLQLALISGEPLDIIDLYELSTDAYIAKDIFVDLYSYLDADPELSRADFVPAFLEMAEQDGKLNFLSMAFSVRTLSAPISLVGDGQGWTVDEFAEVLAAMPEDMEVCDYSTGAEDFLSIYLSYALDQYVDIKTGTMDLRQDDFYTMLELCRDYCDRTNTQDALLSSVNTVFGVGPFVTFYRENAEEYTLIGFPGAVNNGALRYFVAEQLAISSLARCPDGAWEFLKYLVQSDVQNAIGLPVLQSAFDEAMEQAREDEVDADGNVTKEGMTDEEEAAFLAVLDGATGPGGSSSSSKVVSIILEEASAYFAGNCSADDAITIMEDRVSTYLAEQS